MIPASTGVSPSTPDPVELPSSALRALPATTSYLEQVGQARLLIGELIRKLAVGIRHSRLLTCLRGSLSIVSIDKIAELCYNFIMKPGKVQGKESNVNVPAASAPYSLPGMSGGRSISKGKENNMRIVFTDGGRAAAGYKGDTRDCVARALAIVTGKTYQEVYDSVNWECAQGAGFDCGSARIGVPKNTTRKIMEKFGGVWTPLMKIGSGCKVHLRAEELPTGRIIASVSRHVVAVIDGVIHDTHDCTREGTRCVYGYWKFPEVI